MFLLSQRLIVAEKGRMALVVWAEAPYRILATAESKILGHERCDVIGQSIMKLIGPKSDFVLLQQAIRKMSGVSSQQSILYDVNGNDQRMIVSCEPLLFEGELVGCVLNLRPSFAILLQQVFKDIRDSGYPYCLVSSESPTNIHIADQGFVREIGFSQCEVLGKDLVSILSIVCRGSLEDFQQTLIAASRGTLAQCKIRIRLGFNLSSEAEDELICAPVVERLNGAIRHIVVLLVRGPTQSLHSPSLGTYSQIILSGLEEETTPMKAVDCNPEPRTDGKTINSTTLSETQRNFCAPRVKAGDFPPTSSTACSAVYPRRRSGESFETRKCPVLLTRPLLANLAGYPLDHAARALGLSAMAFKRACRKLGVKRWAYRRGPGKASKEAQPGLED